MLELAGVLTLGSSDAGAALTVWGAGNGALPHLERLWLNSWNEGDSEAVVQLLSRIPALKALTTFDTQLGASGISILAAHLHYEEPPCCPTPRASGVRAGGGCSPAGVGGWARAGKEGKNLMGKPLLPRPLMSVVRCRT